MTDDGTPLRQEVTDPDNWGDRRSGASVEEGGMAVTHHLLEPEVAGGLGERTVMDPAVHPPRVERLHYEVRGWLGDDLVESTPCFLISRDAARALVRAGCTGFGLAHAEITLQPEACVAVDRRITTFRWMQPGDVAGHDDVALDQTASLVVSDRALEVLRRFRLEHCTVRALPG